MAHTIELPSFSDERGTLTVIERCLPFTIRRVYYIYRARGLRGGHRHKKTVQLLIAVSGSCEIFVDNGITAQTYMMDSPATGLLVQPEDWHTMDNFSDDCVLLVLASEEYDGGDYIHEGYDDRI